MINPTSHWAPGLLPGIMLVACIAMSAHAADSATGSLNYKGRSIDLKYAWLVTGPSEMEPGKVVRRLILAGTDIGAKLQACKTFSCTDGEVTEADDDRPRQRAAHQLLGRDEWTENPVFRHRDAGCVHCARRCSGPARRPPRDRRCRGRWAEAQRRVRRERA